MQSMFRMWSSEPVVDLPFLSKLKRKSTDSPEPTSPRSKSLKKWKLEHGEMPALAQVAEVHPDPHRNMGSMYATPDLCVQMRDHDSADATIPDGPVVFHGHREGDAPVERSRNAHSTIHASPPEQIMPISAERAQEDTALTTPALEEVIEAQFNYEILLKHEELRLIEVELAKAQTALEQLRRCQLIPFPGANGLSEDVSNGAGPALHPAPGYTRPQQPAPWGVTDGPYTRHFAKWLIPDSYFDPEIASWRPARTRQTRAVPVESSPAPTPVDQPTLKRARLLRKADGKIVDLHCDSCQTSTFGNVQGFLNHMRIKHSMHYKDHEAAAVSCGRPVEGDDLSMPLSTPATTKASTTTRAMGKKPAIGKIAATARTAAAQKSPLVTSGIKPSPVMTPTPTTGNHAQAMMRTDYFSTLPPKPTHANRPAKPQPRASRPEVSTPVTPASQVPLTPSAQTPHLSALMQRRGIGGDLDRLVEESKRHVNFNASNSPSDDEETTPGEAFTPATTMSPAHDRTAARVPAAQNGASKKTLGNSENATADVTVPNPRKRKLDPVRVPEARRQRLSPQGVSTPNTNMAAHSIPQFNHESSELSPHTVESNPGLVSDDDDDDEDDDARSVAAPSLVQDGNFDDMEIEVEDGSDLESRKGISSFKASSSKGGRK